MTRRSVEKSIDEAVTREYIFDLIMKKIPKVRKERGSEYLIPRDQALLSTLYLTAGRVGEILTLTRHQFLIEESRVIIQNMIVLKKRKSQKKTRTIHIPKQHPLILYVLRHLEKIKGKKRLFNLTVRRVQQICMEIDPDTWPHWYRSQRITHLDGNVGLTEMEITRYVGWEKPQPQYFHPKPRDIGDKIAEKDV